jgi:hypothetical protein
MKQTITIPETTLEHNVPELTIVIDNPSSLNGRVIVGTRAVGSTNNYIMVPKAVDVSRIFVLGEANGVITQNDLSSFKKCIKLIISDALKTDFNNTNDPF